MGEVKDFIKENKWVVVVGIIVIIIIIASILLQIMEESGPVIQFNVEIDSIEDLENLKNADDIEQKKYILTRDLDLEGRTIDPIPVHTFEGNGHTIKNAVINSSDGWSGFFRGADIIKNVTFDNIQIIHTMKDGNRMDSIGMVVGCLGSIIDNYYTEMSGVTIKNSKVICKAMDSGVVNIGIGCMVGNCYDIDVFENNTVENCSIEYSGVAPIHIGGLIGIVTNNDGEIKNCSVDNVTISANGNSSVVCGGFTGRLVYNGKITDEAKTLKLGSITNCSVNNVTMDVSASGKYEVYVGGAIGTIDAPKNGNMTNYEVSGINVIECNLKAETSGDIVMGGVVAHSGGKILNCFSNGNLLDGENAANAYIGGLCGAGDNTIQTSLAQKNTIATSGCEAVTCSGFIADSKDSLIINSAVNRNICENEGFNIFTNNEDKAKNCFIVADGTFENKNTLLDKVYSDDWNRVLSKLSWETSKYSMNSDGYVYLR